MVASLAVLCEPRRASAQAPQGLRISSVQSNGWVRISGQGTNGLTRLYASGDLVRWKEIAVLHGTDFTFADPVSAQMPHRFYRFSSAELTETNDWKNQISASGSYPPESFAGRNTYVKFAITTDEPARVYYADGTKYVFHYDFATARLE